MQENLKLFIEKHIDLIENNEFDKLYAWASTEIPFQVGNLTYNLNVAGIDPLKHITIVHPLMYSNTLTEEVVLPEHILRIKRNAFQDCFELKRIVIPKSVFFIDANAFKGCYELKQIEYTGTREDFEQKFGITQIQYIFADCNTYTIHCEDDIVTFVED